MKLIVLVIALLLLYYVPWGRAASRYQWCDRYYSKWGAWLQAHSIPQGGLLALLLLLPLLLFVLVAMALLQGHVAGILMLIFNIIVMWYCLWPTVYYGNGDEATSAHINDAKEAVIDEQGVIVQSTDASQRYRQISEAQLADANQKTFAVLFWFIILAGFGAVLYRAVALLVTYATDHEQETKLLTVARWLQQVLDWIPARLLALSYLISGSFVHSFGKWLHQLGGGLNSNESMLISVGMAAQNIDASEFSKADKEENRHVVQLIFRSLMVWLVVLAIFTLGALIY